jgi:uncharacterized Tic20 family protein
VRRFHASDSEIRQGKKNMRKADKLAEELRFCGYILLVVALLPICLWKFRKEEKNGRL